MFSGCFPAPPDGPSHEPEDPPDKHERPGLSTPGSPALPRSPARLRLSMEEPRPPQSPCPGSSDAGVRDAASRCGGWFCLWVTRGSHVRQSLGGDQGALWAALYRLPAPRPRSWLASAVLGLARPRLESHKPLGNRGPAPFWAPGLPAGGPSHWR